MSPSLFGLLLHPEDQSRGVWIQLFLVAGVVMSVQRADLVEGHSSEYCQWESFNASCSQNEVVMMTTARYGRMRVGRCVKKTYGTIGCQEDIMKYADEKCSGRASCRITVPDISVAGITPCPDDLTSYLEVTYTCIPVISGDYRQCRRQHYMLLPPSGGYISSHGAQEYGYGATCPWRIQASPGQRINLTLYDFTSRLALEDSLSGIGAGGGLVGVGTQRTFCRKYAMLQEEGKGRETPICGGLERVRNVYISEGPVLDIRMLTTQTPNEDIYFAIKYEVIGCQRLASRKDADVQQTATSAVITCHDGGHRWHVHCRGHKWVGSMGNCSSGNNDGIWTVLTEDWSSPKGLFIVIGLGVALGTVIGVLLLILALLWFRRKSPPRQSPEEKKAYAGGSSPQDPLRRNCTPSGVTSSSELNYSTGSTTTATTWGHGRPLPIPYLDEDLSKRFSGDYPGEETLRRLGEHQLTMQGTKTRSSHVYESPKFSRRDIICSENEFDPPPVHYP